MDRNELQSTPRQHLLLEGLAPEAAGFARASKSSQTVRAYQTGWRQFLAWCVARGEQPLPASPQAIANYLAYRAESGVKPSTIRVDLAAIRQAHLLEGLASPSLDPVVLAVVGGIRRTLGVRPAAKEPLLAEPLRAYCAALGDGVAARRDKAMLLVGFAGAFRRSELVAVEVGHLRWHEDSLTILLPRSKTDQEGRGLEKVLHATHTSTCPLGALRAWLEVARIESGFVFRAVNQWGKVGDEGLTPGQVGRLVKRAARQCGLPEKDFSGHSLRAGFMTQAAVNGVPLDEMRRTSHHRSAQVALDYVRRADAQRTNVTGKLGL